MTLLFTCWIQKKNVGKIILVIFFSVVSCDTTEPSNAELMEKTLLELSEVIKYINCFGI